MDAETRRLLQSLAVHPGLCATCEHLRLLASPRSVFVRCGLTEVDADFVRYPPLPVVTCRGYLAIKDEKDLKDLKDLRGPKD
jgi:hypothetical protein